jgi:Large polyvalent protein-associated domain 7
LLEIIMNSEARTSNRSDLDYFDGGGSVTPVDLIRALERPREQREWREETRSGQLETRLAQRYAIGPAIPDTLDDLIGYTQYRFIGDTSQVAFSEHALSVRTETNSPTAVRSMVDVAELRDWAPLSVRGHVDFKRMVWLEASVRGLQVRGYEPTRSDENVLLREREERRVADIGPGRGASNESRTRDKPTRGVVGRKAVLAAIEAVLVARHVPDKQRDAVMAAATEKLAQRVRNGASFRVKVFDLVAPSQQPVKAPTPEAQPAREHAVPVR